MNDANLSPACGHEQTASELTRQSLIFWGVGLGVAALAFAIGYVSDVLLVVFAAVLFAVFLRGVAELLTRCTPLSKQWAVPVAVVFVLATTVILVAIAAPRIASQMAELEESLPKSLENIRNQLAQTQWGKLLLRNAPDVQAMLKEESGLVNRLTGVVAGTISGAMQGLGLLVLMFFIGLYLALHPQLYTEGFLKVVPPANRQVGREVLADIGEQLKWWLVGRMIAMLLVGVPSAIGLTFLGVDLAIVLGALAGLLTCVPNFGPIVALIPAMLMGSLVSPMTALWVFFIYITAQIVETYIFTPLIQQRLVALPPALVIAAQLVMAVFFGALGLALAVPLTVVALALVRRLYVHEALGDPNW
jgi:predicted PurR-regulated permease PerM